MTASFAASPATLCSSVGKESDSLGHNQVPALVDYDLFSSDPVLRAAVLRGSAGWHEAELVRQGQAYGRATTLQEAEDANRHAPELMTHDRRGERIDVVRFHPAWDRMMQMARANGVVNLSFFDQRPGAWVARAASHYLHCQVEPGSSCPSTMTHAAIPVLQSHSALYASLQPKLAACEHDARDLPLTHKTSMTVGMGMTERQGGSDVRGNSTSAMPIGSGAWGDEFLLTGSKWFFSAPMCDAHLVLAQEMAGAGDHGGTIGLSCFYVPRWRPDGCRNVVHLLRLKDKLGNRSNASAEVAFERAWGVRVGQPGRGIATILEMATNTRLDCALSSAALMRQALVQSLHHARHRKAFGRHLIEQPLMQSVLADMALECEGATLLAMDLAARFGRVAAMRSLSGQASTTDSSGTADDLDRAWQRLLTPAAKYWNCKRAVAFTGEAMEVLGGNGYVEEWPMARLFREAPVNSIWEGSGNVMCLDVLRACTRFPTDTRLLLDHLADVARQSSCGALLDLLEPLVRQLAPQGRGPGIGLDGALEGQARQVTQRLVLAAQCALMLQFGSPAACAAFVDTRLGGEWGASWGSAPVRGARDILAAAWTG